MERYFLGNNTAYGFFGNYEDELKTKDKVILLKGGPGTGKSTILKRLVKQAEELGFDCELWYCSGDPKSLDGVFVKDLNAAVVDATAPHASGADLPVIKDVIVDLANSLKGDVLMPYADEIKRLIKCKKQQFMRAYQHLKLALCHLQNKIALEKDGVEEANIRALAVGFANSIGAQNDDKTLAKNRARKVFATAICPVGDNEYFDHLVGKRIYKLKGSETAVQIFFDEFNGLIPYGLKILNPLEPKFFDGVIVGDFAIVKDAGLCREFETVDLAEFEHFERADDIESEDNGVILETALAVGELDKAREYHLELEKYFVAAMDFEHNDRHFDKIKDELFGVR